MSQVEVHIENKTRNEHNIQGSDKIRNYPIPVGETTLELTVDEFENIVPALVKLENVKEGGEYGYDINVEGPNIYG